jgi:ABC-type branched-subunit amino acid transport system permease subunit
VCLMHTAVAASLSDGRDPLMTGLASLGGAFATAVGTYYVVSYASYPHHRRRTNRQFASFSAVVGYVAGAAAGFIITNK